MARARGKHDNTYVSDAYATLIIKSNSELYMPFFDYLSQTSDLYRKAFRCSYGVALEKLCFNLDWFLREEIRVPSAKDQRRIADVFTVLDKRIRLGQKALAAHKRRRKGLVQQLLGGTIRGGGLSLAKGAVE
jgi:restriction endonuclease S subunit